MPAIAAVAAGESAGIGFPVIGIRSDALGSTVEAAQRIGGLERKSMAESLVGGDLQRVVHQVARVRAVLGKDERPAMAALWGWLARAGEPWESETCG